MLQMVIVISGLAAAYLIVEPASFIGAVGTFALGIFLSLVITYFVVEFFLRR